MGLVTQLERASYHPSRLAGWPTEDDRWYQPIGFRSSSGIPVSSEAAQTLSALWQGTRLMGEGLAGMPCQLHRRTRDEGRERLRADPLAYRLRWQPNGWQTAFDFWQQVAIAVLLRGIFLAELVEGPETGFADALIPRHPDLVTPERRPDGQVVYRIAERTGSRVVAADRVFVARGRTEWDGVTPMSVIRYGAQSLGTSLAADQYAGRFFAQGAANAMAVISKDDLGAGGIENLHKSVMAYVGGLRNAFGVLPLEGDLTIETIGVNPHDAQLILARQFGVEDVARWLNMPLHMLRYSLQGTQSYASLEVFSAEFVTYTLRPMAIAVEQALTRDLLRPMAEARGLDLETLIVEFNMDALLRGDLKSRYEAYRIGIMSGFLTRNEARIKENLDPAEGLDRFWEPLNVAGLDGAPARQPQAKLLEFTAGLRHGREGYRMVVLAQQAAARVVRREKAAIEKLAREHAADGAAWKRSLQTFYDDHAGFVAETLQIPQATAREYAARQGTALVTQGVGAAADWDWTAVEDLAVLALTGGGEVVAA